jgi:hypothetical protein
MPGMLPVRIPRPSGSIRGRMIRPFRGMIRGVAPPRPLLARPPNLMSIPNQVVFMLKIRSILFDS